MNVGISIREGERTRSLLLLGTAAVGLLQFLHLVDVYRYTDEVDFAGLFFAPDAVVGIGSVIIAFALLSARRRAARMWSIAAPLVVAVGFIQHHLFPTYSGGANPYFTFEEGFRADGIRWGTVLAIVAFSIWTSWTAWKWKQDETPVPTGQQFA